MPFERDPYPHPKFENDATFTGEKKQKGLTFTMPAHLAQNEQPWCRLNDGATLTSLRRHVLYHDEEAPRDSLDLHLKAMYDQHTDILKSKNETLFQRETHTDDHGRILKNRVKKQPPSEEKGQIRMWSSSQKSSLHSIAGAIESHHNASTNRGYSRKHDGGFYSI